jgi:probable F420-dependent oxidoreductase
VRRFVYATLASVDQHGRVRSRIVQRRGDGGRRAVRRLEGWLSVDSGSLGQIGIWRRYQEGAEGVEEIEALGFGALWLGGSPAPSDARPFLESSDRLPIATGILNVWRHEPADVAAEHARLKEEFGGRFLLGIGIGHPEATSEYRRPLATMRAFVDGLDAAEPPVPRNERVLAALGPKMLDLAAERSLGAHPYLTPVEHTRFARERVGPGVLVAPELTVVVERDVPTARSLARAFTAPYLRRRNYAANLLRHGFTEEDLAGDGSDRLIDAIVPHGSAEQVAEAVHAHLDAGADHVCLQPVGHGGVPLEDYRSLARVLTRSG